MEINSVTCNIPPHIYPFLQAYQGKHELRVTMHDPTSKIQLWKWGPLLQLTATLRDSWSPICPTIFTDNLFPKLEPLSNLAYSPIAHMQANQCS